MTDTFYTVSSFSEVKSEIEAALSSLITGYTGTNTELGAELTSLISRLIVTGTVSYEIQVAGTDQYLVNGNTFTLTQLIANMESTVGSVRDVLDFFNLLPGYETDFQLWNSDGSQILGGMISSDGSDPAGYKNKVSKLMDQAIQANTGLDLVSTIKVVNLDTRDPLSTKFVIDGETLFSELSDRGLDSAFKVQNNDAYFSTLTQQKDFLFLDSITVQPIIFEYKIGSDVHTRTVSWNEIDISGSSGPYHVYFSDFANTSDIDDLVYGTSGNDDRIIDKDGHDTYLGFAGDDTFQSRDVIDGNIYHGGYGETSGETDGVDTINYEGLSYGVSVSLADGISIGLAQKSDFTGAQDQLISIENIVGTNHDDFLDGNNLDNKIEAGKGYDIVQGFGGNDRFIAQFESNVIGSSRNGDSYDGGEGTDSIIYMSGLEQGVHVKYNGLVSGQAVITVSDVENFSAGAHYDTLTSIENIELSQAVDSFTVTTFSGLGNLSVDALSSGGVGSSGKDKLVFSDMAEGIELVNGVVQSISSTVGFRNFEEIIGTASKDKITNGGGEAGQFNSIKTEAGDDEVISLGTDTKIDLGLGNDKVQISGNGNVIYSGAGNDKITIALLSGNQAYLADADSNDQIINFGEALTGGSKQAGSESAWTEWTDGVKYSVNTLGELVIQNLLGGSLFVAGFNLNPFSPINLLTAGIKIYEIAWDAYLAFREAPPEWGDFHQTPETLAFEIKEVNRDANPAYDPLVLDLDGDGIELTTLSSFAPQFDLNHDGFAERAGWVSADDGMLAIDLNGNGTIDNGSELFGNATTGGLAALSAYDTDLDGSITAADAAFSSLKIWRDLDQDGGSDANELKTLSESGIQSISLTPTSTTATTQAGNTIAATGTYTKTDGSTGTTGDVVLNSNGYDTKWLGSVTVSPEISAMANLKGHGTLSDLHQAMALDSGLATVVNSVLPTLNTPDLDVLRANVIPFLSAWMASIDVPAGLPGTQARIDVPIKVTCDAAHGPQVQDFAIQKSDANGTYWALASGAAVVDELGNPIARPTLADIQAQGGTWDTLPASVISFMERWTGLYMPIGLDGGETGSDAVNGAKDLANTIWQELQMITVRLASQGGLAGYFEGISYDVGSDKFVPTTDAQLVPFIQNIFEAAPGTVSGDQAWLQSWKPLVDVVLNDYDRPGSAEVSYSYLFQNVVAAYENSPLEISLTTAAAAFSVPASQIVTSTGIMTGTDDNDLFYLGEGNQTAQGGNGPDSYIVGRNFGQDIIDDTEHTLGTDLPDSVRFAHLKSTDVTLTRDQSDLIISVNGTADQLRIVGEFATRYPSFTTGYINDAHGVSELVFADGIVWDKVDMARESSHPEATSDIIYGTGQIDFLDGGAGNDYLSGSNSGDVYIYGRGYGHDVIEDEGAQFSTPNTDAYDPYYSVMIKGPDILNLKDLTLDEVSFSRSGEKDMLITVNGTTDTLLILNQFNAYYGFPTVGKVFIDQIEYFSFADGDSLSAADIMSKMLVDAKTTGNDTIIGFSREDVLDGGAGDDYLSGLDEADTYIFGRGYGHDTIFEGLPASSLTEGSNIDRLIMKDILPGDVIVSRGAGIDDIKLTISDTGDSVTIIDQAKEWVSGSNFYEIEEIVFSNGAIWTTDDMQEQYLLDAATSGSDTIIGFMRDDVINGATGNDRLEGRGGSDTYVFDANFGQDVIYDYPEYVTWNGPDTVEFRGTWTPSDFTFSKVGYNLVIQSISTSDKLTIEQFFSSVNLYRIENFKFSNGVILTDNDIYTTIMGGALITGTESADTLTGNSGHNRLEGLGGNDTLKGLDGNDILIGGDGNDTLEGGNDNDTYIADSGADIIKEQSGSDEILFGPGITLNDLDIYRLYEGVYSEHLMIVWSGGSIKVDQQYYDISTDRRVELIRFDDGSTYNLVTNDLITKGTSASDTLVGEKYSLFSKNDTIYGYGGDDTIQGLTGNDTLYGGEGNDDLQGGDDNDTLDGGDGNDLLEGGNGNDTYVHSQGNDTVSDSYSNGGIDKIVFEAGILLSDLSMYRSGDNLIINVSDASSITIFSQFNTSFPRTIESLEFANGSTYSFDSTHQIEIRGTASNDTLNGNSLNASINDLMYGYAGNDTISAKTGDDIVYGGDGNDTLNGEDGNDYLYGDAGADTLNGGNNDDTIDGGSDADTIDAGSGNDTVIGGAGDDIIYGKAGNDTISAGDGDDVIYEVYSGIDVIDGGAGNDTLDYSGANSYRVTINLQTGVQSDSYSTPSSDTIAGIENVIGGSGNDTITGSDVANILQGGSGNDALYGQGGNDILKGDAGTDTLRGEDGNDLIYGGSGLDTMYGGLGADSFVFEAASAFSNIDVIKDFSTSQGDKVDIKDLLIGYDPLTSAITDFLQITTSGSNSIVKVDRDGAGTAYTLSQISTIEGVTGLTDEQALLTNGNLVVA